MGSCYQLVSITRVTWWITPVLAKTSHSSDQGGDFVPARESGSRNFPPVVRTLISFHWDTKHRNSLRNYMDLQCVGSSSSLSSSGISFSPTMLSITLSRGPPPPPPPAPPLFLLRLLGAETTASRAERCFLSSEINIATRQHSLASIREGLAWLECCSVW